MPQAGSRPRRCIFRRFIPSVLPHRSSMLKERSRLLQRLLFIADLGLIALAWIAAWIVRFEVMTPPQWVPLERYLGFLPGVLAIWGAVFLFSGLYRTQRAQRLPLVVFTVARAVFFGLLASVAGTFFFREFSFSRLHMLLFGVGTSVLLVLLRLAIYAVLRRARGRVEPRSPRPSAASQPSRPSCRRCRDRARGR